MPKKTSSSLRVLKRPKHSTVVLCRQRTFIAGEDSPVMIGRQLASVKACFPTRYGVGLL